MYTLNLIRCILIRDYHNHYRDIYSSLRISKSQDFHDVDECCNTRNGYTAMQDTGVALGAEIDQSTDTCKVPSRLTVLLFHSFLALVPAGLK